MKKILNFINPKPLIWFHYIPLVGCVFLGYWLSNILNLMFLIKSNPILGWFSLFMLYYIVLLIGDNLIHAIIGED
jgi:hypothetical protein